MKRFIRWGDDHPWLISFGFMALSIIGVLWFARHETDKIRATETVEEAQEDLEFVATVCQAELDTRLVIKDIINYLAMRRQVVVTDPSATERQAESDRRFAEFQQFVIERLSIPPQCESIQRQLEEKIQTTTKE